MIAVFGVTAITPNTVGHSRTGWHPWLSIWSQGKFSADIHPSTSTSDGRVTIEENFPYFWTRTILATSGSSSSSEAKQSFTDCAKHCHYQIQLCLFTRHRIITKYILGSCLVNDVLCLKSTQSEREQLVLFEEICAVLWNAGFLHADH